MARCPARQSGAAQMRFGFSWLDLKLGLRMLRKYPGVTIAGSAGMAVAIGLGASLFEFFRTYLDPALPLAEGDRIVSIQNADFETRRGRTPSLHDFEEWRTRSTSIVEIGAFRPMSRNVVGSDGSAEPVSIAEITATGLRVARTEAQLGRTLSSDDELP